MIENKIDFFVNVVEKTFLHIKHNKKINILLENEYNTCFQLLNKLNQKIVELKKMLTTKYEKEIIISKLQFINNDLSSILKSYGTSSFDKLLTICFGNNKYKYVQNSTDSYIHYKNDALKNYFHPTGYKVVHNKHTDVVENNLEFECSDVTLTTSNFYNKIYGMKVYIKNVSLNKSIIVYGIVDDIAIELINNFFISDKLELMKKYISVIDENKYSVNMFNKYISSLSIKDLLSNSVKDLYSIFTEQYYSYKNMKKSHLNSIIKDFLLSDLYSKRKMLLLFYYNQDDYENTIISHILFDLLSGQSSTTQNEQLILLDSLPVNVQPFFFSSNKLTVLSQNDYSNKDIQSISLEQRIQLLKTPSSVKEKALIKLKEIKTKPDDNNSKARHYLDGLLNIPFGIIKNEPVLTMTTTNRDHFQCIYDILNKNNNIKYSIPKKKMYTNMEIIVHTQNIKQLYLNDNKVDISQLIETFTQGDKQLLIGNIHTIQSILKDTSPNIDKVYKKQTKTELKQTISQLIQKCMINVNNLQELKRLYFSSHSHIDTINSHIEKIQKNTMYIQNYITEVDTILDQYVYGNITAKSQIQKIIGQWINGENKGYCFGFEGPPGVGKTTLAKKGIANCLKDENGISRPFAFIQMGGDTNGSTLNGHNYTYVGSNWGSIVQILMDTQIMNPIIYIDEVDKISKTEYGRELVGILTHLLDFSQNDKYQDKYYNGIDIDMSKALFILSYNDPSKIDSILLDRIHRVHFNYLSTNDKIVITKKHLLPDILSDMGLQDMIHIEDNEIQYLIEKYTMESGVRKLKELLFEIIGEINIDILKKTIHVNHYPINISISDIQKYLKERHEIMVPQITEKNEVGIINGMWANSLGQGGILKIFANFYPSSHFMELKLTGLLEKVMQESMHVAQTLSWTLTPLSRQNEINSDKHKFGIHIHAGEGSISKDGPSGGVAITTLIYSLLNNLKIRNHFAITGEIDLYGNISEIGGLDLKIMGSIKSGVTSFIFPESNRKDYEKLLDKYKTQNIFDNMSFHPVTHISEVFEIIFEN